MQHCEEPTLSGGSMHAGLVSTTLGLGGIPAEAEQLMIARDVLLNRTIGCRYHVQHVSTAGSVELIRRAKKDGQPVTAEVAPEAAGQKEDREARSADFKVVGGKERESVNAEVDRRFWARKGMKGKQLGLGSDQRTERELWMRARERRISR